MKKRLLALLMAATMVVSLTACGGGSTTTPTPSEAPTPTEAPKDTPVPVDPNEIKFTQAPSIQSTLAVTDRIPVKEDVFFEQVDAAGNALKIGTYGSDLNFLGSDSGWDKSRAILESIIHYNTDGSYYPNVIKSFSYSEDYKVWTFVLRQGMKWSDGEAFTADDIVFWYEACHKTNFDTKASWVALKDDNGEFATLTKVNDYTVTWTFGTPKYPADFIENGDFKWCWAPAHYLKDMIPNSFWSESTLSDEDALANAKAKGLDFATVKDLGKQVAYYFWNWPGIPTLNSYVLSTKEGVSDYKGALCIYERNEFFWKVDAKGQQLPYCDNIKYTKTSAEGQDLLLFRDGTLDMITVAMGDIASTLQDLGDKAYLRTFSASDWGGEQIAFNFTTTDKNYADLFAKQDFRKALSIAVDRTELSEILTDGFLEPAQCAPAKGNFGYDAEWSKIWTEYDVAAAKALLEGCGLKMGTDGYYTFADGTPLTLSFLLIEGNGHDNAFSVLQSYWKAVGIKADSKALEIGAFDQKIDDNDWQIVLGPHTSIAGLSLRDRVAPFVPVQQAAEWYGDYGTWYGTNGEQGVEPTGDMKELINIYEQWKSTPDSAKRDELTLKIYELHKKNIWSIAFLETAGTYQIVNSKLQNFADNLASADLYQYNNIVHWWCVYREQ